MRFITLASVFLAIVTLPAGLYGVPVKDLPARRFTKYVDLRIGTDGGGHTFPGPTLPHGLVKVGIDTTDVGEGAAGYTVDGNVTGISHLHVCGTGGGNSYQVISLLPLRGPLPTYPSYGISSRRASEEMSVGYMRIGLRDFGVDVEMSATRRAAVHRYTWWGEEGEAHVLIDLGHMPSGYYEGGWVELANLDERKRQRIFGYGSYRDTWSGAYNSPGGGYKVYFCAEADGDVTGYGTWNSAGIQQNSRKMEASSNQDRIGAYITFAKPKNGTTMHVGISFVSIDKACENLETELPASRTLESVYIDAVEEWEDKLRAIELEGASEEAVTIFYSSLYRTMLMPVDRTGENPKWVGGEYFDDFYCIWDTFRSVHPLLTLIHPQIQSAIVRALINIQQNDGYLPDSRVANWNGMTQAGSNADVVLADAFVKSLPGIDWEAGYAALVKDAEVEPPRKGGWLYEGRGDLEFWKNNGWIPAYNEQERWLHRSVARTVEYSYNDFCISKVAQGLGLVEDAQKYLRRSSNWQNLWNLDIESHGAKGFVVPRGKDGKWWFGDDGIWEDVTVCSPVNFRYDRCYLENDEYYESSSWAYSLYVPQDVSSLIELSGGMEQFQLRLENFFDLGFFDPGNEPSFHVPFMFNYVGRPDKTARLTRKLIHDNYHADRKGIPGNDDSGAMGSWFVFTTLGFFPIAGQDLYLLASPHFSRATIYLDPLSRTKTFSLIAHNTSVVNIYIQRAVLNGQELHRSWFLHTEIMGGGILEVWMGNKPSDWGTAELPPSYPSHDSSPELKENWGFWTTSNFLVVFVASATFVTVVWIKRRRSGYREISDF